MAEQRFSYNEARIKLEFERDELRAAMEQAQSFLYQNSAGIRRLPLSAVLMLNHAVKRYEEKIANKDDEIFLEDNPHLEFDESDDADDWFNAQDRVNRFMEDRLPELDRHYEKLKAAYVAELNAAPKSDKPTTWVGTRRDLALMFREQFQQKKIPGRNENDAIRQASRRYVDSNNKPFKPQNLINTLYQLDRVEQNPHYTPRNKPHKQRSK